MHCINRHQYNTLEQYVQCRKRERLSERPGRSRTLNRCCELLWICSLLSSISFYSPLRADRKLSIKCFIIMRCSLNFVQVPVGSRNYVLTIVVVGVVVVVSDSTRRRKNHQHWKHLSGFERLNAFLQSKQ